MNIALVTSVGSFWGATGILLATADPTSPINVPLQYGALGILGFMIWVNSKERRHMITSIDKKDQDFLEMFKRQLELTQQLVDATKAMVSTAANCARTQAEMK